MEKTQKEPISKKEKLRIRNAKSSWKQAMKSKYGKDWKIQCKRFGMGD